MSRISSLITVALVALLAQVILAGSARSTVIVDFNLHDLALEADLVVVGTVSDLRVVESPDRRLTTRVTLEDLEVLSGDHTGSTLSFDLAGAYPGGGRYEVAGMPLFRLHQRNLLFLRTPLIGRYMCPVVGWDQGRLIRAQRSTTGEDVWLDATGRVVAGISDQSDWQPASERMEIPGELPIDALVRESQEPAAVLPADAAARESFAASNAAAPSPASMPPSRDGLGADELLLEIQRYIAFPDPQERLFRSEDVRGERLSAAGAFSGPTDEVRTVPEGRGR